MTADITRGHTSCPDRQEQEVHYTTCTFALQTFPIPHAALPTPHTHTYTHTQAHASTHTTQMKYYTYIPPTSARPSGRGSCQGQESG